MKLFLTTIMSSFLFSMTVFAANAADDILDKPRFEGAIKTISFITNIVDNVFVLFISFVAFFIISAAVLRNVLAGAYCVFPKFWDKVHMEHEKVMNISISSASGFFKSGYQNASMGSVTGFILGLLPDIKVLTDFEKEDGTNVDYKRYFMRALPQAACAVFVGVFIYNGYYRDTMSLASRYGDVAFTNFITQANPEEFVERYIGFSGRPDASTDGALVGLDFIVNKTSWSAYNVILGHYRDLASSKQTKQTVIDRIESHMKQAVNSKCASYFDTDNWNIVVDSRLMENVIMQDYISDDGNTAQIVLEPLWFKDLGVESTTDSDKNYCVQTVIKFTRDIKDRDTQKVVEDFVLILPNNFTNNNITCNSDMGELYTGGMSSTAKFDGDKKISYRSGVLAFMNGVPSEVGVEYDVTGLFYNSAGALHKISKIRIDNVASPTLQSSQFNINIKVGEKVSLTKSGAITATQADDDD